MEAENTYKLADIIITWKISGKKEARKAVSEQADLVVWKKKDNQIYQ